MKIRSTALLLISLSIVFSNDKNNQPLDSRGYSVKLGEPSPNFILEFPDGSVSSFDELRGEVIMLQFTASWCSVCREEMPHIEREIWRKYKKAGLQLIGIDRDEPREVVKKFAKEMRISYPLAMDSGAVTFEKFAEEGSGVTRNIIINSEGEIVCLTRLFDREEFNNMIAIIHAELDKKITRDLSFLEKKLERLMARKAATGYRSVGSKRISHQIKKTRANLKKTGAKRFHLNKIALP